MTTLPAEHGFWLQWTQFAAAELSTAVLDNYHHWSADELAAALALGHIHVNGRPVSAETRLIPADKVSVFLPQHREAATDNGWKLLWKNQELMAVHKPAPLPVSRTTRNLFNTLISLVRRDTEYKQAHLLHRLDAETSGLILLANYPHADKKWKKRLDRLLQRKVYHALVWGVPDWQEQEYRCFLAEKSDSAVRTQMHVVGEDESGCVKTPKLATTRFRVLQRGAGFSLLECELLSGRKHQIRAQLAHLGHAIIGDKIYSQNGRYYLQRLQRDLTAEDYAQLGAEHHLLHACRLELDSGREQISVTDEYYPPAWQPYLAALL